MDEKWKVMGSGEWAVFTAILPRLQGKVVLQAPKGAKGGERREGAAFRSILSVPF